MSNGKGDSPRNCFSQAFRDNFDSINWGHKPMKTRFMSEADTAAATAPVYPGQLPVGTAGAYSITERMGDGSEIIRNFSDEDLAMQCAVRTGLAVEENK